MKRQGGCIDIWKCKGRKLDACHLWALFCEGKLCDWVRQASVQAVENYWFNSSKAIEETCGAACHHVARFLRALAAQQFHEARSLLCGVVWLLSHNLRALCSRQPDVHFAHHAFLHTGAILTRASLRPICTPFSCPTKVPAEMVLHWAFGSFSRAAHCWFSAPLLASLRKHPATFENILDAIWPILALSIYIVSISGKRGTAPYFPASMMQKRAKTMSLRRFHYCNFSSRTPSKQDPAKTSQNWNLEILDRMTGRLNEGLLLGDFKTINPPIFPAFVCLIFVDTFFSGFSCFVLQTFSNFGTTFFRCNNGRLNLR